MSMLSRTLLTGNEIVAVLDDLATLRLTIFEEFPYLYRGKRADELAYLRSYAEKSDACVLVVRDGALVVGAATGMPLIHEDHQLCDAMAATELPLDAIYYVGELLFLPAWRNRGLGQKLLTQMEAHIRSLGRYRTLTCATVERPDDHPLRPPDYTPITRFLARTGFDCLPGIITHFTWCETDGVKREHAMRFWLKQLNTVDA